MAKKKISICLSDKHLSRINEMKQGNNISSIIEKCIDVAYTQSTLDRLKIKDEYLELVDCINDIDNQFLRKEISEKLGQLICPLLK